MIDVDELAARFPELYTDTPDGSARPLVLLSLVLGAALAVGFWWMAV